SSKAWFSYLADEPCAVLLVDRRHVPRADALEERERLLEEGGLQIRPLAIVVGVLGGDGLNLPLEAQHVAKSHQGALQVEGRGHPLARRRPRGIPRGRRRCHPSREDQILWSVPSMIMRVVNASVLHGFL